MKVKLISATQNPIDLMWTAARTCYSEKSPIDIWDEINKDDTKFNVLEMEKRWNLVKTVLDSGHESIAESVNFTFAIEGVSRSLLAQITRHRTGVVFSVQSQRYVEFEESFSTLSELFENPKTDKDEEYLMFIANKYFIGITNSNYRMYIQALLSYLHAIKLGAKPEDARMILPNATKTNIVMTINLRELMHTSNLRLCCFDDKTEILTHEGWKFFKDLQGGELFYSLNPVAQEGELVPCKRIINEEYNGEMISVRSQSISLNTTPNHKMYCAYSYRTKKFGLDFTYNHDKHKRILMKKSCTRINGELPTEITLNGYERSDSNQYTEWTETKPSKQVPIIPFLRLLGFFISDGYVHRNGQHYDIGFSKGDRVKLEYYKELLCQITEHKPRIFQDKTSWKLEVHDRYLYNYFEKIGKTGEKHIPQNLFKLDSVLLHNLFLGLMDGDAKKDGTSYSTVSKQLADDFQRLCLHVGYSATLTPVDRRGQQHLINNGGRMREIKNCNIEYRLTLNRTKNEPIIKTTNRNAFSNSHYNGNVYCVELEKNNIVYVRREGRTVWSGNSRAQAEIRMLFGIIREEVKKYDERLSILLKPTCFKLGYCPEHKSCHKKPTKEEVFESYLKYKGLCDE